jgi:hypothetical protein
LARTAIETVAQTLYRVSWFALYSKIFYLFAIDLIDPGIVPEKKVPIQLSAPQSLPLKSRRLNKVYWINQQVLLTVCTSIICGVMRHPWGYRNWRKIHE